MNVFNEFIKDELNDTEINEIKQTVNAVKPKLYLPKIQITNNNYHNDKENSDSEGFYVHNSELNVITEGSATPQTPL